MMAQRQRFVGLAAVGVIVCLLLLQHFLQSPPSLAKLAAEAEEQFQEQEALAKHWLERIDLWEAIAQESFYCDEARIVQQAPIHLFFLKDQRPIFWNTIDVSLSAKQLADSTSIIKTRSGDHYYLARQSWQGGLMAVAALPLSATIQSSGTYTVNNQAGSPVYHIDELPYKGSYPYLSLLIESISILLFIFLINILLRQIKYRLLTSFLLLLAGSIVLIWISHWEYPAIEIIQDSALPLFSNSSIQLRHIIVGAMLSFWCLSNLQLIWSSKSTASSVNPFFAATIAYLSINCLIIGVGVSIKHLMLHQELDYDFDNVLQLPLLELICILAILMLLVTHLLYSLWVIRAVQQLALTRQKRFLSIGLGILIALPVALVLGLDIGLLALCLILLLFTSLLDLFVELDTSSPAWLILWLSLLSIFATGLFFKYQIEVSNNKRLVFAKQLANYEDKVAEHLLDSLVKALNNEVPDELLTLVEQDPYLEKNYFFALQDLDTSIQIIKSGHWTKAVPNSQYISYTIAYNGQRLALQPKWNPGRRILNNLIPSAPLLQSPYNFAICFESEVIIQKGYLEAEWLKAENWDHRKFPQTYVNSQRALLYDQSDAEGYQVLVTDRLGGYLKPASLFSYLFALLTLIVLAVFIFNKRFRFFPATPAVLFIGAPSLRYRIQLSTIGLTLATFILAGWVTVIFIRDANFNTQAEQLLEKVDVVLRDVAGAPAKLDSSSFLASLSAVHQVDLFSYTSNGALQAASFSYLFDEGIRAPYLTPYAFYAYQKQGVKPAILQEKAGDIHYLAAYVPFSNHSDMSTKFLVVAFASGEQSLKENTVAFIGNLLNLYIFLLLIASASAIAVAKTITRPLLEIGEKLRRFKLGENEPLSWDSEDEVGQLIMAYNAMIAELEVSTEKLKQSEREGAWREMAKQVAHEIKNPLTPMKLSIQYLQHAQQSDPEKARSLISRVSKTLIEQIDGLAHIATAFSNFAKMPKAELTLVNLNAIISSVYQLFTEGRNHQEEINLELPDQPIMVNADGKQLLRIFNNLLKNAQQAIPEKDQGNIQIQLYKKEGKAIVSIKDNGTGISKEIQPKVFQPNFTTKSSGMGLGLAMCKNMIEAMEGDIYFETEEEKGTTFYISLPICQP